MWATVLKIAPILLGALSSGSSLLHKSADANKGVTLAGIVGAGGLFSNPEFRNFLAEMLAKAAELLKSAT